MSKQYYRDLYEPFSDEELLRRGTLGEDLDADAHAAIVEILRERNVTSTNIAHPTNPTKKPLGGNLLFRVIACLVILVSGATLARSLPAPIGWLISIAALVWLLMGLLQPKGRK